MSKHAETQTDAGPSGLRNLTVSEQPADTGRAVAPVSKLGVAVEREDGGIAVASETSALISMIERAARDPSVDLDKMERLFAMKERMEAGHSKQAFLAAFAKLQRILPAAAKKGVADKTKYARFEDIIEAIKEPMADLGFSLSFRLEHSEKAITVTGVLGHEAGHSEQTSISLPPDAGPKRNAVQAWGSAVTYGKRYVAVTLLGIATEDDDGKASGEAHATPVTEQEIADFREALKAKNVKEGEVCQLFSVETLDDLTRKQFDAAVKRLANTKVRK